MFYVNLYQGNAHKYAADATEYDGSENYFPAFDTLTLFESEFSARSAANELAADYPITKFEIVDFITHRITETIEYEDVAE